jgi:hypothetical protein
LNLQGGIATIMHAFCHLLSLTTFCGPCDDLLQNGLYLLDQN